MPKISTPRGGDRPGAGGGPCRFFPAIGGQGYVQAHEGLAWPAPAPGGR
jgi:hypothetical protein